MTNSVATNLSKFYYFTRVGGNNSGATNYQSFTILQELKVITRVLKMHQSFTILVFTGVGGYNLIKGYHYQLI